MTTFVHVDYPAQHPGVARAERAVETFQAAAGHLPSGGQLARTVLGLSAAVLLVAAAHWVDIWTERHLLAAWTAMWLVIFAAGALYHHSLLRLVARARAYAAGWSAARRQAAEDARYWEAALTDARIMADISRAMAAGARK